MEEDSIVLALSDGTEVELIETWVIDDETHDSYPEIDIVDCETEEVLGSYRGTLPDTEDEDFDCVVLIEKVEGVLRNN